MRVDDLTGAALDWAVAKAENETLTEQNGFYFVNSYQYSPSTNWAQGGAIIEREKIKLWWDLTVYAPEHGVWFSQAYPTSHEMIGRTPLESAMRCYVLAKFGLHINVPEELK